MNTVPSEALPFSEAAIESGPRTIGLCPASACRGEFHAPDAALGERCPYSDSHDGDPPELVIYTVAPSGSTGVQPSAVARRAAFVEAAQWFSAPTYPQSMRPPERRAHAVDRTIAAAYAIDAPAIAREAHAAGVEEGRAAMLREVVAWARLMAIESPVYLAAEWNRLADAIAARFPGEGTT